jgi:hypothetical protein
MHRLGRRPPAEAKTEYHGRLHARKRTGYTLRGMHETGVLHQATSIDITTARNFSVVAIDQSDA